jgi:mRNA-degrading endonuclease RelE of RelBE toxin-antitoxin system
MAEYRIEVTENAKGDLSVYTAFERKTIIFAIRGQLAQQPSVETRKRKKLRDNPVASWELRAERYLIFYEVDEPDRKITIIAIGHKEHSILYIRGKEVRL